MCRTALVQLPDEEDEEDEEAEEAEEVDPDGWETVSESEEDSVVDEDEDEDSVDAVDTVNDVDIEDTDSLFSTELVPRNLDEEFALEQNQNSEDDYFNHEVTIVNADVEKNMRGFRRMAVQAKIFYEQQDMLKEQEAMAKEDFDA